MNHFRIHGHPSHKNPEDPRRSFSRRGFLGRVGTLLAVFFSGIHAAFAQTRLALGLDKVEKLKEVGGFIILKIQEKEILFIRDSEDKIRAVNPICTHQKCRVTYLHEKKIIACPCHGSNYGLDGSVIRGPAEKPLHVFNAELDLPKSRLIFTLE